MPRLVVAIVRHGDYRQRANTPSAHQPFELTERGRIQAVDGADRIVQTAQTHAWAVHAEIQCSRLLRAWQTAVAMADELTANTLSRVHVREFDDLAERGLGIAANLDVDEIEAVLRADPRYEPPPAGWKSNSHYRLPLAGAESLIEAGRRVARHMRRETEKLAARIERDTLLIQVGHGAAFRHAAYHLGVLQMAQVAALSMHHANPVYLERHSDTRWEQVAGDWKYRADAEIDSD